MNLVSKKGINTDIPYVSNIYYYPVLPKYNQSGEFTDPPVYSNKIPFPLNGIVDLDSYSEDSLKVSITSEYVDTNIFSDLSGKGNYGFTMSDYKPKFDNETLEPKITRNMTRIKTSSEDGAF